MRPLLSGEGRTAEPRQRLNGRRETRHAKYLRFWETGEARMFRIENVGGVPLGAIGWWTSEWEGRAGHEAGWFVTPEHHTLPLLTAFPRVDNPASNSVCRKAGFSFYGEQDDEYPPGNPIRTRVWFLDLEASPPADR